MNADEQDRAETLDNYRAQLRAMVEGDTGTLAELLTEDFSLTHMRRITADATVYGAHAEWPLQLTMDYVRTDGGWLASRSEATTW
jgi:hypothetical protein